MRLFGWTIAREKAEQKALQPVDHRGGWFSLIRESFAGRGSGILTFVSRTS